MKNELSTFFNSEVLIKEFKTGFGPCVLGAISKDANNLKNLEKLFIALESEKIPRDTSDIFLKNLAIFALKFGQFILAEEILNIIEKNKSFNKEDLFMLKGLSGYHTGELIKSSSFFEEYLKVRPSNQFIVKLLLSNGRELNKIYLKEINTQKELINTQKIYIENDLMPRIVSAENKIMDLEQSKIVGSAIKLRGMIGGALDPIRNFRTRTKDRIVGRIPAKLKYVIKLKWLARLKKIDNQKYPIDQPLVSVVIPYYNRASTIGETIDSLGNQTFINFEIIIVDDHSTEKGALTN